MKAVLLSVVLASLALMALMRPEVQQAQAENGYDVYRYVAECKQELEIAVQLPQLSCLDGSQVPIYVDAEEIHADNWEKLLSNSKKCDNPHWLGGDVGCWTYSHLQVLELDSESIMVVNCRQKGDQLHKHWFRNTRANLGMNQQQRKQRYENGSAAEKKELYYLYNTFNDIGIILRNTQSGKSCYITQYGEPVAGFLPPLDEPLPTKQVFLNRIDPEQARPPDDFPEELWYRDANAAFKSPEFTAAAGCVACHNAHGVKYSPYINSHHGLPDIYAMSPLPFLPVGQPFIEFFEQADILQVTTPPIDGESQLCTRCHNMTTSGTCGYNFEFATDHPDRVLDSWLTEGARRRWMPPIDVDSAVIKKHSAVMKCCCENPRAKGCKSRRFGPRESDLPAGFSDGRGWVDGREAGLCQDMAQSFQWNGDQH